MSSEWGTDSTIGQLVSENGGSIKTGPFGTALKASEYVSDGVPLISVREIGHGSFHIDTKTPRVSPQTTLRLSEYLLESGDIVFARKGGIERCSLVRKAQAGWFLGSDGIRLRPPRSCDARFLAYSLQTQSVKDWLTQHSTGSTMASLNQATIARIPICIPSIGEQSKVADCLETLDDRITLLRETNATLEAIAQALFKSWFVDFDPVHAKQQGRAPEGMDEATAALFPDGFEESALGLVPKGWQIDRLEQWLAVLETGRRPKGGVSGIENGIPSIGAESIFRMGEFDFGKTKFVSTEFFEKMKSGVLESRDVLLYKDGGKPGVFLPRVSMFGDGFPFEICGINEHVFRIRLKKPFGQTFLYFWLWSDAVMHELKHRGGKAAIPGINQTDVKEQRLSVPNALILEKFENLTCPLVAQVFSNAKKIQSLISLRDTLLPRLISGQIRLPEAESVAMEAL